MAYQRKIAYFDLLDYGQKKGNAGFCKWEQRNDQHILAVLLNGLSSKISEPITVYVNKEIPVGTLSITGNRGEGVYHLEKNHNWNQELYRIHIPLSENKELVARFREESMEEKNPDKKDEKEEKKIHFFQKEKIIEEPPQEDVLEEKIAEAPSEIETEQEQPIDEISSLPKVQGPLSLWEKLERSHEKMRPFGTKVEYFRIGVEDIGLFKEEYWILRNNQFLLHGFYNYHYLILGKKSGEEDSYWLGVPGIYHEREKMAARMYGFEKFEGANPGYQTGDLGYYLITAK